MKDEKIVLEKFSSLFVGLFESINEKNDVKKIDNLIKDIEKFNLSGNEDVKNAIVSLKRAKDLGESYNKNDIIIIEEFDKKNKEKDPKRMKKLMSARRRKKKNRKMRRKRRRR